METYQNFQRAKGKAVVTFPLFIGNMEELCPSAQAAKSARLEIEEYPFNSYQSRDNFDPHHHIRSVEGRKYKHEVELEDYWANAANEFEVRKRIWSQLPVNLIRTTELFRIPDQVEDDGVFTQPGFDESRPLLPIRWSEPELVDLDTFMRPVVQYSQWWVDQQVQDLWRNNVELTYDLMGKAESYSSNTGASQGSELVENVSSRKRKSKDKAMVEDPVQKKQKSKPPRSATSANINDIVDIERWDGFISLIRNT